MHIIGGFAVLWQHGGSVGLLEFVIKLGCYILFCRKKRCECRLQKDMEGCNGIFVPEGF